MQQHIVPFFDKINLLLTKKQPFVVYKKPNEELVSLRVQTTKKLHKLVSFNDVGFVFAPFESTADKILFPIEECESSSILITQFDNLIIDEKLTQIIKKDDCNTSKEKHIKLVDKAIAYIKSDKAKKIVLSREELVNFSKIDIVNTYKKMLKNYNNAFVYLWCHPEIGLWMGATPERLINIENNNFKTMALAATQPYLGTTNVTWPDKEKHEQQYVTDFILKNIEQLITNVKLKGAYTVKAGNLLHLRTDIYGELVTENSIEKLITALHPTPAVCGLPKDIVTQFILENEGYNRAYYSGYLGELNINKATRLFVNLRCMKLTNKNATLYIGGGITEDSIAEKEWLETVFKAQVMKKVL